MASAKTKLVTGRGRDAFSATAPSGNSPRILGGWLAPDLAGLVCEPERGFTMENGNLGTSSSAFGLILWPAIVPGHNPSLFPQPDVYSAPDSRHILAAAELVNVYNMLGVEQCGVHCVGHIWYEEVAKLLRRVAAKQAAHNDSV